jgi:TetR/AcrR family transcriptional repressor of mexCD-oprJ operon
MRTSAAILEAAIHVLAENPDASVNEIAVAAGVGRATMYRYFPTREELLKELGHTAWAELAARIADARFDRVPVPEALERLLRAMLTVTDHYIIFVGDRKLRGPEDVEFIRGIDLPMDMLFQRGLDDGTFRPDLDAELLKQIFGGLVVGTIESGLLHRVGMEHAAELITSMFLDGARR